MFWHIPSAKPQAATWASLHPAFMGNYQTIILMCSPIYLLDEFISLLQVLPKEMRMLGEFKILSFFVSGVN